MLRKRRGQMDKLRAARHTGYLQIAVAAHYLYGAYFFLTSRHLRVQVRDQKSNLTGASCLASSRKHL